MSQDHYYGDGCPEDSVEHWRDLYEAIGHETIRLRDQVSVMSKERRQWEKDVRAAAKRQAWDDALFNTQLYLKRDASSDLYSLAYQLEHLPDERLRAKDLFFVKDAARRVRLDLDAFETEKPDRPLAEVRRLREALYAQGRRLHDEYGPQLDDRQYCRCPGCELTRAAELHEVTDREDVTDATTSDHPA